ncbi:sphingomyelin phosphodiesterase-like protein 2 [Leptotrombidium deliense]|uniref:Sphingomyelin phosphodiesterase-like protein 2 n=1 Tax=Leptotrombidium deliense TaxID=299467 RepID=A0A443SB83_9ACAR|nr:sphingomyelin phosphodiesterase-like protein 2 [Leptotrombidium deliense]
MCAVLLGNKCSTNPQSMYEKWEIKLPDALQNISENKLDLTNVRILHLSDIHFDPHYKPGTLATCDQFICCRETSVNGKGVAGYWGTYTKCDAPLQLVENLVQNINKSQTQLYDLLLWTGDTNPHDQWQSFPEDIVNNSNTITSLFKKYLSNGKIVVPCIGNHEGFPVYQLSDTWSDWLVTDDAKNTFKRGGYYSLSLNNYLKIIVLNTNLCATYNLWSLYDAIDPGQQLQWFVDELTKSERDGEIIYVVGHIPPNEECTQIWFHNYVRISDRFKKIIKAYFYGHTHRDEFKLYFSYENRDEPIHVAYIAPSITVWNPGYRFYLLNSDGSVGDTESYYLNLTEANKKSKSATIALTLPNVHGANEALLNIINSVYHITNNQQNSNLTTQQMCGVVLGKKCLTSPPSVYETWTIPLPEEKKTNINFNGDMKSLKILHLSDFHFDPLYKEGSLTTCDQSLCCRESSVNGNGSAGYWGYYAKKFGKHFKAIALNTNICDRTNFWNLYSPIDPYNQLHWMTDELQKSEENGENVYILGHIAPDAMCTQIWFHNFLRITERYRKTIKGFFYGHTHRDEFKLYYSPKNKSDLLHVGYIGPSVTSFNPGFRFYSLHTDGSVENIHSYYLNLTEANEKGKQATLKWRKLYEAKQDYGLKSLSPQEWQSFYNRLLNNDTLTQFYYGNVIRHSDAFPYVCDEMCKKLMILGPIPQKDMF